jgi:hypothetical protein
MTAQPIEPTLRAMMPDPRFIHDHLPAHLRSEFVRDYTAALDATREQLSYLPLRDLLVSWNKRLILSANPGAEQELADLVRAVGAGDDSVLSGGISFDDIRR